MKEQAQAEADRLSKIKNRMREVLELCRPVMDFFGIGIDNIERRALLEEWNKRRLRLYQVSKTASLRGVDCCFPCVFICNSRVCLNFVPGRVRLWD